MTTEPSNIVPFTGAVLLVEDNEEQARVVQEMLLAVRGLQLTGATSSSLKTLIQQSSHSPFDVIVLGDSPGKDLKPVLGLLRDTFSQVPIVILVSESQEISGLDMLGKDIQDYLVKGRFDAEQLLRSIRYAVHIQNMETQLQHTRERFDNIVRKSTDGIIVVDAEGDVLFANPASEEIFGREQGGLLGKPFGLPIGADQTTEIDILKPDRTEIGVGELHTIGTRWHEKDAFLIMIHDVTYLKAAEAELRAIHDVYRKVIENANSVPYRLNYKTGEYDFMGEGWGALLGIPGSEFKMACWQDLVKETVKLDPNVDLDMEQYREAARRGELDKYRADIRILTPQGEEKWLNDCSLPIRDENTGEVVASLGILTDVTERKRIEESLRENERKYRILFEQAADSILLLEIMPDGMQVIRDVNAATLKKLGYERDEIIDQPVSFIQEIPDDSKAREERRQAILSEAGQVFEERHLCKDGTIREFECSVKEMKSGGKTFALSIERDITERVHAEKEKERLEGQLHQSQKMEVIGQLAGGVVHDFNNLLQIMQGYTRMTLRALTPDSEEYKDLEEVYKATEAAATLTRQLLAVGRKQPIQPEQVDINTVVENVSKMLRRIIREDIAISLVLPDDLGTVLADPGHLEQVLLNLCVNARDAMPEGGRLAIETRNVFLDRDYRLTHPWAKEGKYVLLTVSDTGTGIATEVQEHIFEPFFTTKEGKGTGLGLSTVYGIVKQHHGDINVYSEVNVGTTFRIYLPAIEMALDVAGETEESLAIGGTETILLAEDDEKVRAFTTMLLVRAGYTVLQASDGEEAVKAFEQASDKIALVILDAIMPKMSGRLAYERIKALKPDTPVVFSSGYSSETIEPDFFALEKVRLIQKPFTQENLLRTLREVLDKG